MKTILSTLALVLAANGASALETHTLYGEGDDGSVLNLMLEDNILFVRVNKADGKMLTDRFEMDCAGGTYSRINPHNGLRQPPKQISETLPDSVGRGMLVWACK